jgi:hypothetical protein
MRIVCVIVCGALLGCKSPPSPPGSEASADDSSRAEQAKAFRDGWGPAPATPGPVFAGLALGGPARDVVELHRKLRGSFSTEYVTPDGDDVRMSAMLRSSRVVIDAKAEDGTITDLGLWTNDARDVGCPDDLAAAMGAAWKNAPHAAYQTHDVWLDPTRRVRALLDTGPQCRLTYERYEPAETWIDNVVHLELVGKPASAVAELGVPEATWQPGSGTVEWSGLGCGLGGGITGLGAELDQGVIVSVRAGTFGGEQTTFDAVLGILVARRGKPREVSGLAVRRFEWDGDVPLRLDHVGRRRAAATRP